MDAKGHGILDLPDGPLNLIFQHFDTNLDRESFALACSHFLDVQNKNLRFLDLGYCPMTRGVAFSSTNIDSAAVDRLLKRFRFLRTLALRGKIVKVTDYALSRLWNYGPTLKSLTLDGCKHITDLGISYVASGCLSLSYINIATCSVTDIGIQMLAKACTNLEDVNIANCVNITDHGIWDLSQCCRELRRLNISCCNKISGKGFQGCSPSLKCLEAGNCALEAMGILGILSGGGLQSLHLSSLKYCYRGNGLTSFSFGIAVKIEVLDLSWCGFVTDHDIVCISRGCPMMYHLDLSGCTKVGFTGWYSIGTNCENLDELHVNGCHNLCDIGLLALAKGCKKLTVIYMTSCRSITQAGIFHFKSVRENVEIRKEETRRFLYK